jgi:AraC family transcriptional regulator
MTTSSGLLEARIVAAMRYMEQHLHRELALDEIARAASLSPYHFHRLFRAVVGEPAMEYARRLRLEHAAYRLRSTRRPVLRIALEVGYESVDAFGRAFRARFGQSPSAFRREQQEGAHTIVNRGRRTDRPRSKTDPRRDLGSEMRTVHTPLAKSNPLSEDPPRIVSCDSMRFVCLRHIGPYNQVWRAWKALEEWAVTHDSPARDSTSARRGPPRFVRFGMSHDDPSLVPAERLRYDAALLLGSQASTFGEPAAGPARMTEGTAEMVDAPFFRWDMPKAEYAVVTHRGAYHHLGDAYTRLYEWLPWSGREPLDAPPLEWYRNDPRDVDSDDLLTDILLPLR